jgi:hypothetical protein
VKDWTDSAPLGGFSSREELEVTFDNSIPVRRRTARRNALLALTGALLMLPLVLAVPATGQPSDPTAAQYVDSVDQVAGDLGGGDDGTSGEAPPSGLEKKVVGGLPITGLDLIALVAVAIALTSMGFALRRLTADQDRTQVKTKPSSEA